MKTLTVQQILKNGLNPISWAEAERDFIFKIVKDDKRPGVVKVIIKRRPKKGLVFKNDVSVYFVRDGYLIKRANLEHAHLLGLLGVKQPIRAKNLGALFDKYEVPKSLRKVFLAKKNIHRMCMTMHNVKSLLPVVEDQVKFYTIGEHTARFLPKNYKRVKGFLSKIPQGRMLSYMTYDHLVDTRRMVSIIERAGMIVDYNTKPDTLHDWASIECNKIQNPNITINYAPTILSVMGEVELTGGLSIKLVEDTYELVKWGQELKHCIGTYRRAAVNNEYLFFAVYVEGVLTYTIQSSINFNKIIQFYGYRNKRPEVNHTVLVNEYFKKCFEAIIAIRDSSQKTLAPSLASV